MGMFDEIDVKRELKCPKGHWVGNLLQTKSLLNFMTKFEFGKTIRLRSRDMNCTLGKGWFIGWTLCDLCDDLYDYRIIVNNGKITNVKLIKESGRK